MQVYDLKQLLTLKRNPVTFQANETVDKPLILKESAWYGQFGNAHNIAINEESGFAYVVGTKTCNSGLHIIDIKGGKQVFAGCYQEDGYIHDTQCVIYSGPDHQYRGKEICFCYDESTLAIVDVSDKQAIKTLSITTYPAVQYTHQGWLLDGQGYLLLNDELDELNAKDPQNPKKLTRTLAWDVQQLRAPKLSSIYYATQSVIDHNLYILDDLAYLSNYCGGLRILDAKNVKEGKPMKEVAYFDVSPNCNKLDFLGSWSSYIYFPSRTIVVNSIDRGLFVLKLTLN